MDDEEQKRGGGLLTRLGRLGRARLSLMLGSGRKKVINEESTCSLRGSKSIGEVAEISKARSSVDFSTFGTPLVSEGQNLGQSKTSINTGGLAASKSIFNPSKNTRCSYSDKSSIKKLHSHGSSTGQWTKLNENSPLSQIYKRLMTGTGSSQDYEAMVKLAAEIKSGESGAYSVPPKSECITALAICGFCAEFGIGREVDIALAVEAYEAAAELGEIVAQTRLVFLLRHGRPGVRIDRKGATYWENVIYKSVNSIENEKKPLTEILSWLVEGADILEHPDAQYCLGICYQDGLGMKRADPERAVEYYRRGAIGTHVRVSKGGGHARCQGILGYCYGQGVGVSKDEEHALIWYERAASQGEAVAIYNVGYCYEEGLGVPKDENQAIIWYQRAADLGNAFAQNSLGYCYEDGIGVEKNTKNAVYWYRLSASQGYPWAQCNLGYCYQNAIGVPRDEKKGAKWYHRAADQGYPRAQHNIGYCLQNGIGVRKDEKKAIEWYRKAAEQGNVFAFHSLGFCYQHGIGIKKDEKEAVRCFLTAAEANHAPAQLSLGYCYRNGIGVSKDDTHVFKWFRRCAEGGNAIAQNSLGYCYQEAVGVQKNLHLAAYWYKMAARQNYVWAEYNLGRCYADGLGVESCFEMSRKYLEMAAEKNLVQAQMRLASLFEEISLNHSKFRSLYGNRNFSIQSSRAEVLTDASSARRQSESLETGFQVSLTVKEGESSESEEESSSVDNTTSRQSSSCEENGFRRLAMRWYMRAALSNYAPAQYHVGRMYENGIGVVDVSLTEAVRWYSLAATGGDAAAAERLKIVLIKIGESQNPEQLNSIGHTAPTA